MVVSDQETDLRRGAHRLVIVQFGLSDAIRSKEREARHCHNAVPLFIYSVSFVLRVTACWLLVIGCTVVAQETATWRTIAEIRQLPRSVIDGKESVKIRGVVTLTQAREAIVIQDDTDAIYAHWSGSPAGLRVGDRVEATGQVALGRFAPLLRVTEVRKLGQAAMPTPVRAELGELKSGRHDCHLVLVRGVARWLRPPDAHTKLTRVEIATLGGPLIVILENGSGLIESALVDAEVEVTGCCFAFFNPRGEITGVNLRVQNAGGIRVLRAAPADPFSAPEISAPSLRPFRPEGPVLHRQRVTGIVTLRGTESFLFLQAERRGFRVHYSTPVAPDPGERVEVSGFVEPGASFSVMTNAVVRRIEKGRLPEPLRITAKEVLGYRPTPRQENTIEDFDGSLVQLTGSLIKLDDVSLQPQRLYVDHQGSTIAATFAQRQAGEALARLREGAVLELTGVCQVNLTSGWSAPYQPVVENFDLLLHSAEFVRVAQAPPWWTVRRLATLLVVTAVLLVAAVGGVILFRRLALRRSRELAAEVIARENQERAHREAGLEFQATMRERERLAADLHDTVEQSLTGIALQLDATRRAPEPGVAARNLALATQMLARSREDVRRSVWNLRAQALEGQMLRDALRQIAGELLRGTPMQLEVLGEGVEIPLPDLVAGNLLMLAKEAVTNALKHSGGTRLEVRVDYSPGRVTLEICDDGCGFPVAEARGPHLGHFGLTGMRERAARLNASLSIESKPRQGTRIVASVPFGATSPA
jgi:signal transduction histidine kinase